MASRTHLYFLACADIWRAFFAGKIGAGPRDFAIKALYHEYFGGQR